MRRYLLFVCVLCGALSCAAAQAGTKPDPGSMKSADRKPVSEYERVGRFIYAFHRTGASRDQLDDPVVARRAPPELARRAAALAEKYDAIVAKRALVPDEDVQATLIEAEAVGAALKAWWDGQAG